MILVRGGIMYDVKLAKELKKRDNIDKIGGIEGRVISIDPLKISILNGDVILNENHLYICQNATEYTMVVTTPQGTGTALHEGLKLNDRVAIIAAENNQKFFVIDKIAG